MSSSQVSSNFVGKWLISMVFLVVLMVAVGGLTRLTGSGLSMVDWKLLMGVFPPLSASDWDAVFRHYQDFPQYQKVYPSMTIHEFKRIFYWEYAHRMLGRTLGLAFLLPYVFFLFKGYLKGAIRWKLLVAMILGGAQGFLGWFMVQSGLVEVPRVSHLRLAAHLLFALVLGCYLLWLYWDVVGIKQRLSTRFRWNHLPKLSLVLISLVILQITYGAFTAGLHAGLFYNTFPSMNGYFIPPHFAPLEPFWKNLILDSVVIQFIHRVLGMLIFLAVLTYIIIFRFSFPFKGWSRHIIFLALSVVAQVSLGIATLLLSVPVWLASFHQLGACVLLFCSLYQVRLHYKPKNTP